MHHRLKKKYSHKIIHKNKKKRVTPVYIKFLIAFFSTIIIGLTAISSIFAAYITQYTHDLPDITPETFRSVQTTGKTVILDRNGKELYTLTADKIIDFIPIDKVGRNFKWSMIASEDATFYHNDGVAYEALVRASLNTVKTNELSGGVSTISQQVIKNLITGTERDAKRKIREAVLAMELNRRYSKDKILEIYINLIPMGGVNYGIKRAANLYFGKEPDQLTLAEAAYLAGVPQQPTEFAPPPVGRNALVLQPDGTSLPAGVDRQRYVLKQLEKVKDEAGITQEEIDAAYTEPLNFVTDFTKTQIRAPHFVNYVREQLAQMYGGEDNVRKLNLTVRTSIDVDIQEMAEEKARTVESKLPSAWDSATGTNQEHLGARNLGISAVNATNGDIVAMVGSKDFFGQSSEDRKFDPQTNFTTSMRSMGSSMKPCMFLGFMARNGATPNTITPNVTDRDGRSKLVFEGWYRPQNYTPIPNVKEDKLTLGAALNRSLNIPAIYALSKLGLENYADFCGQLGYDEQDQAEIRKGLSTVLGAAGIKQINHANVYATIANGGIRNDLTAILDIKDKDGNMIYNGDEHRNTRRVVDEYPVRMLNSILINYPFGALDRMKAAGYYGRVAGKTGTNDGGCQRDRNGNIIKWYDGGCLSAPTDVTFAGYTGGLSLVVTVGNSNNYAIATTADGAAVATTIWSDVMLDMAGKFPSPRL